MKKANLVCSAVFTVILALGTTFLAGCDRATESAEKPVKSVADYFPIKVGDKTVQLQFAILQDEMQKGLMGRRDLQANQGMIFLYTRPTRMSFYMLNTPTPLDIGFFAADGTLKEIYQMYPFDQTTVNSHSYELQFAVEMNQNWYRDNDVRPGAKLDLKAVAAAIEARGFEPHRFGLDAIRM